MNSRLTRTSLTGLCLLLSLIYLAPVVCFHIRDMPSMIKIKSGRDSLLLSPSLPTIVNHSVTEDALFCQYHPSRGIDAWFCGLRGGMLYSNKTVTITRKLMREARTIDPKYPYLMNASSSPTFGVALEDIYNIEFIEDSFLADYPHISVFSISAQNVIKRLKRNMFMGARELQNIQIQSSPELIEIDEGIFAGLNHLESIILFDNPRFVEISAYLFKGIPQLVSLEITNCGVWTSCKSNVTRRIQCIEKYLVLGIIVGKM